MDDTPALSVLGRFIRERRSALKLTQAQLAERLRWSQERISVLENGKYGLPSVPALVRLAEALDVPFGDLLDAAGYQGVVPSSRSTRQDELAGVALGYALQQLLAVEARSVEDALNEASDLLVRVMAADKIDAFLYASDCDSLLAVGTSDTPMGRRQHELGLDREPLANGGRTVEVYRTGQPFYTPRADQDPRMVPGAVTGLGIRSYLAVPLQPDSVTIGVLAAASARPDRFSEDEREFFAAVSRWVAMIARRAELTEELTRVAAADARRLAAEEMVTLLAHDLGNALTPIKGRLDLLRRRLLREGWEGGLEDLDEASRSLERARRMVTELLDVARIDGGIFSLARETIDLVAIVEEVVADVRPMRETITTRLPDQICVHADPARIRQALQNLLSNAVTHTPADVPIILTAATERRQDGQWVIVTVHDEGPGIPESLMGIIFTRFASGPSSPGLGVGLYLARAIVDAHGGELTVESTAGKGTTFSLSLPVHPPGEVDGKR